MVLHQGCPLCPKVGSESGCDMCGSGMPESDTNVRKTGYEWLVDDDGVHFLPSNSVDTWIRDKIQTSNARNGTSLQQIDNGWWTEVLTDPVPAEDAPSLSSAYSEPHYPDTSPRKRREDRVSCWQKTCQEAGEHLPCPHCAAPPEAP